MMSYRAFFSALTFVALLASPMAYAQQDATYGAAIEETSPVVQEEKSGGMPQLDPTYYPSQLFWLLICGLSLYAIMSRLALPRVSGIVNERDDRVRHDLEQAYKLKQQAEDLKIGYTRALRDADEKSRSMLEKIIQDLNEKKAQSLAESSARMAAKIAESKQNLQNDQDAFVQNVPALSADLAKSVMQQFAKGNA